MPVITLRGEYRDGAGNLADPTGQAVSILGPTGAVLVAPTAAVRDGLGLYHYDYAVPAAAALGTYTARWSGTIAGAAVTGDESFDVVAPPAAGGAANYGATLVAVRALLPHRAIPDASALAAQAERHLDAASALLAVRVEEGLTRLRSLSATDARAGARVAELTEAAGVAVALGGAALLEDAGFPERANLDATDTSYGAVLWARFLAAAEALAVAVAGALEASGEAGRLPGADQGPAHGFPEANLFSLGMKW